ncbi:hypothetical protein MRBLMI12_000502 [Microbacterium sp. LMI12-1-1.1]|uniref:hypothetical protein n=1 Tax=Microbacterium sp. LMI12-1-1.1 TaxID=3135225 RepID=UPI0034199659
MKVLLATPCYGGAVFDIYMRSVLNLTRDARDRGIQVDVLTIAGESLITRARNNIVSTFAEGDWTDLLFVDGDIGFEPENAWRLLESRHDVCATPYPLKRIDWDSVSLATTPRDARTLSINTVVNYAPGATVGADGFAECLDAGTGFMRITRDAVELLIAAHPELEYQAEEGAGRRWALFDTMLHNGRYLSEDYAFCRRWQAMGGQVMTDTLAPALAHRGLYEYGEAR